MRPGPSAPSSATSSISPRTWSAAACPGRHLQVHPDILKFVYDKGKGAAKKEAVGEVLYNRTVINAMLDTEAIRTAMAKFGNKPLTGEQVRWGMENLNLTEKRLDELGMKGMMRPLRVTCENHEGNGLALVQQWDGKKWAIVSDWIEPMREVVGPKLEAAAVEEGKKLGYTMRDCAKTISDNEDIKEFYLGLTGVGARKSYRDVKHYRRRKRWLS